MFSEKKLQSSTQAPVCCFVEAFSMGFIVSEPRFHSLHFSHFILIDLWIIFKPTLSWLRKNQYKKKKYPLVIGKQYEDNIKQYEELHPTMRAAPGELKSRWAQDDSGCKGPMGVLTEGEGPVPGLDTGGTAI